jgi:CubicO group peptidase (beta-lactamase class C family)
MCHKTLLSSLLALPLLFAGTAHAAVAPGFPDTAWPTAAPVDMGVDGALLQQAIDYSTKTRNAGGSGTVIYRGKQIAAWGSQTARYDIKSSTKSFGSALAGIAIDEGRIALGDTIKSRLPSFGTAPGDLPATDNVAWRNRITIKDALTHTSGINKAGATGNLLFEPGTQFSYSDNGMNRVADVLTSAWDLDLKTVLQSKVFDAIGVTTDDYTWRSPADAAQSGGGYGATITDPSSGVSATRREFGAGISIDVDAMARYGYLMLHHGNWAGRQVVPASYVQAMSHPTSTAGVPNYMPDPLLYANASSNYGLGWWNNAGGALPGVPRDAYWSWGLYDSFVMVIGSLDLVITRAVGTTGWLATPNWGVYATMEPFFAPIVAALPPTAVDTPGAVGGTVPATLALTVNGPIAFGSFVPGLAKEYAGTTTAGVISTAGDATLTVADPSAHAPGHLVNGAFALASPLQARVAGAAFAPVGPAPLTLTGYAAPASNDTVSIDFKQPIGATEPLRTGSYAKTLTFTLATTTP